MRSFQLHQPATVTEALEALASFGLAGRALGGGTDLVAGVMRDQLVGSAMPWPADLVDVAGLTELRGIRFGETGDTDGVAPEGPGLTIGAATTLIDIAESPAVRAAFPMLAEAAAQVASPEIRAVGTLGGNLHQRPRCWFFRNRDFDCIKKGGSICFAVKGDNRYNAILDGNVCFIVHPSDLGSALVALGARARVASARGGERTIPFDEYFVSPTLNLVGETALRPDELLLDVTIPAAPAGTSQLWEKVNEKGLRTWDFALVSVAALASVRGGVWQDGRIVLGAVAPVPWRARVVEDALRGRELRDALPDAVAAFRSAARPMRDNAWKVELAATVLERSLAPLGEAGADAP
jgi:xanthine dehydrogenase YagS FAD-binding subunit